jgi:hypothetical protein
MGSVSAPAVHRDRSCQQLRSAARDEAQRLQAAASLRGALRGQGSPRSRCGAGITARSHGSSSSSSVTSPSLRSTASRTSSMLSNVDPATRMLEPVALHFVRLQQLTSDGPYAPIFTSASEPSSSWTGSTTEFVCVGGGQLGFKVMRSLHHQSGSGAIVVSWSTEESALELQRRCRSRACAARAPVASWSVAGQVLVRRRSGSPGRGVA